MDKARAYVLGLAFATGRKAGKLKRRGIAVDADEKVQFRTVDHGKVIAIKNGEVVGGAGTAVGRDQLPTFSSYMSTRSGLGFTAGVRNYAEQHLKPVVEALRFPKGMPSDCERIVMGKKQIRELAAHMNADKAEVLPYVAEVYRRGSCRTASDYKHAESFDEVVYTVATIDIGAKRFKVELVSKKRKGDGANCYIQYGISKADKAEDAKGHSVYQLERIVLK